MEHCLKRGRILITCATPVLINDRKYEFISCFPNKFGTISTKPDVRIKDTLEHHYCDGMCQLLRFNVDTENIEFKVRV